MRAKVLVSIVLIAGLIWALKIVISAKHWAAEHETLALAKAQRADELSRQRAPQNAATATTTTETAPAPIPPQDLKPSVPAVVEPSAAPIIKTQKVAKLKQPKPKDPLTDPDARDALSLVGLDPAAEAYWYYAINDPNVPVEERKDLIEDLNEHGLADPKHPSPDDLPVILRRIQLVEALGPEAMDEANAAAFDEAYKDLLNLARLAAGAGGEPVR